VPVDLIDRRKLVMVGGIILNILNKISPERRIYLYPHRVEYGARQREAEVGFARFRVL
jgi:hypothetical protein